MGEPVDLAVEAALMLYLETDEGEAKLSALLEKIELPYDEFGVSSDKKTKLLGWARMQPRPLRDIIPVFAEAGVLTLK